MSYPIDLYECPEEQLRDELARRAKLRAEFKCDYCLRLLTSTPCKLRERHRVQKKGRIVSYDEDGAPIRADISDE